MSAAGGSAGDGSGTVMEHLSDNNVRYFVSFERITEENLRLAARVNSHILHCEKCFEAVRNRQRVYDLARAEGAAETENAEELGIGA